VRPALFRLPPEPALRVADQALAVKPLWRLADVISPDRPLPVDMAGIALRNPVGLAAGLDKQCAYLDSLGHMGFGYVVGGTVTYAARPGNPKPRVLRLTKISSLINALGFPSEGLGPAVRRLERLRDRPARVMVSIAALDELETQTCVRELEPHVDALELNISSPNTAGLRKFQEPEALRVLLAMLNEVRRKPLFVKLPPYSDDASREGVLGLVRVCREVGVTGFTTINTVPVEDARLAMGRGGLSGAAILADMLRVVPEVRAEAGAGMVVNACGGIATADDAARALAAGADTVQLYSSLVFRGPGTVRNIVNGLAERD
jgi:dihydroorotate dehydrogenase